MKVKKSTTNNNPTSKFKIKFFDNTYSFRIECTDPILSRDKSQKQKSVAFSDDFLKLLELESAVETRHKPGNEKATTTLKIKFQINKNGTTVHPNPSSQIPHIQHSPPRLFPSHDSNSNTDSNLVAAAHSIDSTFPIDVNQNFYFRIHVNKYCANETEIKLLKSKLVVESIVGPKFDCFSEDDIPKIIVNPNKLEIENNGNNI